MCPHIIIKGCNLIFDLCCLWRVVLFYCLRHNESPQETYKRIFVKYALQAPKTFIHFATKCGSFHGDTDSLYCTALYTRAI